MITISKMRTQAFISLRPHSSLRLYGAYTTYHTPHIFELKDYASVEFGSLTNEILRDDQSGIHSEHSFVA